MRGSNRFWLAFAAVLVLAAPAAAQEGNRVVVESIGGQSGARLRALLIDDLREAGITVIPDDEVERAEEQLGISGSPSDEQRIELARALRATAFISGTVSRARRSWRLVVRVRSGHDGVVVGTAGWSGRTLDSLEAVGRNGAARLADAFASARSPEAHTPVADPEPEPEEPEEPPPPEPVIEEPPPPPPFAVRSRYDPARLALSVGSLWRSMSTTAVVYAARRGALLPGQDPRTTLVSEPRSYTSSGIGHAELGAEGELYPGAIFGDPQLFPYLGLVGWFRSSAGLASYACRAMTACEGPDRLRIDTQQIDTGLGVRGRYRFGESRGDVELFGELLYGYSSFTLDGNALREIDFDAIVPSIEIHHLRIGVGMEAAAVPDLLSFMLRFDVRPGLAIGPQARETWGLDTGAPFGFGIAGEVRHQMTYLSADVNGLYVALRLEYFQYRTDYRGQVGCASPGGCPSVAYDDHWRDPNLWETWPIDPNGNVIGGLPSTVEDHYVRWGLYVGYAFR